MFARFFKRAGLGLALVLATATYGMAQYKQINLVTTRGGTLHKDPHLVNAWGMTFLPGSPFWISDAFAGVSTLYDQFGNIIPLVVTIPPAPSMPFGPMGLPTGIVANPTGDFVISKDGKSGPALFIFATLDGTISGWNPNVDLNNAIIMVDNSNESPFPASYTGLAIGRNSKGRLVLYAADSGNSLAASNNRIDMFDSKFRLLGHFGDPDAPSKMTVYGIQNLTGRLYVTYAPFDLFHGGAVDVFDTNGDLLKRLTTNGPGGTTESPWGLALAPSNFGRFSNDLLVGNVDDGHIHAFDPNSGAFLGTLENKNGSPITIPGLWTLLFGGGTDANGKTNELFFCAGTDFYSTGLFGKIVP